jgi:uncharacterized protein YihD (DUF1040 family)
MRDIKRIKKILGKIEEKWNKYPDMRFYQLLINMGLVEDTFELWKLEDDKVIEHLKKVKL